MNLYRVYQDGVRCVDYKIGDWDQDTFDSLELAEVFATTWCFPMSFEDAKKCYKKIGVNTRVDMSMGEYPVMMEIKKVKNE